MAARVWPVDAVSGSPSYNGRSLRQLIGSLITGGTASRPLGGRNGVSAGTPSTTVTATTSTWTVATHSGCLDVEASVIAGPYLYAFDAAVSGSLVAADSTNPRIDLISVQLSDPAESDGSSTPGVAIVATTGTPAASPSVPTAPARSLVLAQISVPKSGGGSPAVTWVAPYTTAAGGIIPTTGPSQYPPAPYEGQVIDDASTDRTLRYSGSAWTNINGATMQILQTNVTLASGSTSGLVTINFNRTYSTPPLVFVTTSINGSFHATAFGETTTQVTIRVNRTDGSSQTSQGVVLVKVLVIDQSWS